MKKCVKGEELETFVENQSTVAASRQSAAKPLEIEEMRLSAESRYAPFAESQLLNEL